MQQLLLIFFQKIVVKKREIEKRLFRKVNLFEKKLIKVVAFSETYL